VHRPLLLSAVFHSIPQGPAALAELSRTKSQRHGQKARLVIVEKTLDMKIVLVKSNEMTAIVENEEDGNCTSMGSTHAAALLAAKSSRCTLRAVCVASTPACYCDLLYSTVTRSRRCQQKKTAEASCSRCCPLSSWCIIEETSLSLLAVFS
jgi:hypothetical protein